MTNETFAELGQRFGRELTAKALDEATTILEGIQDTDARVAFKQVFYAAADASYKAKIAEAEAVKQAAKAKAKMEAAMAAEQAERYAKKKPDVPK